jgi:imidazolonepropionase-like amidohydrolase
MPDAIGGYFDFPPICLGSIETGKWADFTVLAENPLTVDPTHIRDIQIWGTVLAGVKQPGTGAAA